MEMFIGALENIIYVIIGALLMYLYLYIHRISKENARLRKKLKELKEEQNEPDIVRVIDITDC